GCLVSRRPARPAGDRLREGGDRRALTAPLLPLPAAEARADRRGTEPVAAAHPPRPGARVPDRGSSHMSKRPRAPALFPLDELNKLAAGYEPGPGAPPTLASDPDPFAATETLPAGASLPPPAPRGRRWSQILFGAIAGLVALALGLAVDDLIRGLFSRNDVL